MKKLSKTQRSKVMELANELMLRASDNGKFETRPFDYYYQIAQKEILTNN